MSSESMETRREKAVVVMTPHTTRQVVDSWMRSLNRTSKRHVIWPKELMQLVQEFAQVSSELVIKYGESAQLLSGLRYFFEKVKIGSNAILFASRWDAKHGIGGTLRFECDKLEVYGTINMNSAGYKGGKLGRQGESYTGIGKRFIKEPNGGGGGYGAHAGYATRGASTHSMFKSGGMEYGSNALDTLYLGSGGGSGLDPRKRGKRKFTVGGNGGGIVDITVRKYMRFERRARISANGEKGGLNAGDGSGGSIRIICKGKVHLGGQISAKGGSDKAGNGRIAIYSWQTPKIGLQSDCTPLPFFRANGEQISPFTNKWSFYGYESDDEWFWDPY